MPQITDDAKEIELDVVGSSTYGRSPKISACRTFNLIISDNWLVDYAGYKNRIALSGTGKGRGIFGSIVSNVNVAVVNDVVYKVDVVQDVFNPERNLFFKSVVGHLDSFSGDVYIKQNSTNTDQIAICDQKDLWIYFISTGVFQKVIFDPGFVPAYVESQDGYFICPNRLGNDWAISAVGNGLSWNWGPSGEMVSGAFQTKADNPLAVVSAPGKGGFVYVIGNIVTELWSNQPTPADFSYVRNSSSNIDYGTYNSATIAVSRDYLAWFGRNDDSGPAIMYAQGADTNTVKNEGLNYLFSKLNNPSKSSAFFVKLSNHLLYQLTFYDPQDNFSVLYDFSTQQLFDVTDENQDHHIARRVNYFSDRYYFVSFNDGNMYELNDQLFTFDYGIGDSPSSLVHEIPRIRVCSNIRTPKADQFVVNNLTFTVEQGDDTYNTGNDPTYNPRIGLCISKDGGYTYSQYAMRPVYKTGVRKNKLNWWQLGLANDLVPQIRFFGKGPVRMTNGIVSIYV